MSGHDQSLRVLLVGPAGALEERLAARFETTTAAEDDATVLLAEVEFDAVVADDAELLSRLRSLAPGVAPYLVSGLPPTDLEAQLELGCAQTGALRDDLARARRLGEEALELTYTIVHDLKGQLQGVVGLSGLLLEVESERLSPSGREWCQRLERTGEQLAALAEGVVKVLRVSRSEVLPTAVRLDELVPEILAEAASDRDPAAAVLTAADDLPEVFADPRALRRALVELLRNAIAHNPTASPRAHLAWRAGDARGGGGSSGVTLLIVDNGPGIPAEELERVFEPFYRARRAQVGEVAGPGIGLALVRKIAERHHGASWADSEPNAGATFCLYLPARA